jgi:hypothetical protein
MPNKNWKREKTVIDQKTDSDRVLDRVIDQKTDSDRVIDQKTDTTVTRFLGLPGLYSPFPPLFLPPPPAESPLLPAGLDTVLLIQNIALCVAFCGVQVF